MNKIDDSLAMSQSGHFAPLEVKVKSVFPKSFGKQDLPGGRKLADALCRHLALKIDEWPSETFAWPGSRT